MEKSEQRRWQTARQLYPTSLNDKHENYQSKRMYEIHPPCHDVSQIVRGEVAIWRRRRSVGVKDVFFEITLKKKKKRSPLVAISRLNKFMLVLPTINKVCLVLHWAVQEVCARSSRSLAPLWLVNISLHFNISYSGIVLVGAPATPQQRDVKEYF